MSPMRTFAILSCCGLALGLSACGGDDDGGGDGAQQRTPAADGDAKAGEGGKPVSQQEFAYRANRLCSGFQKRLDKIRTRAEGAKPAQRAGVLRDTAKLLDELGTKLRGVPAPAAQRADYRKLLDAFKRVSARYRDGARAFAGGDAQKGARLTNAGVKSSQEGVRLATKLKLPACGSGG